MTDDDFSLGGYRFEDLQNLRIVENRTDLNRKQKDLGFPRPVKTGKSQAWFPKSEVHAWLRERAALRDVPIQNVPPLPEKSRSGKANSGKFRRELKTLPVDALS
jgi:hypothetical protein